MAQSAASYVGNAWNCKPFAPVHAVRQLGKRGAALGIQVGQGGVRNASAGHGCSCKRRHTCHGSHGNDSGRQPTVANTAAMRIDNRGPLRAQPLPQAPVGAGAMNISITINAAPGQDERAIARAVTAEFERWGPARSKAASRRFTILD